MSKDILSLVLAALITFLLVLGMYGLIKMDEPELGDKKETVLPGFTAQQENEDVQTIAPKPERPEEIQDAPDIPDAKIVPDVDIDTDMSIGAVKLGINRDLKGFN